jgi:L-asparaginase II
MSDETNRSKSSVGQTVAALATIVLTILGLAHVVPDFLVAIATIAFGAALLLHGSAMIAEYARANVRLGTAATTAPYAGDGGLSAVLLAGVAGVVLGILALLGISTHELTAIAVIAFGAALILSASSALRVHLVKMSLATPDERSQRLIGDAMTSDMLSSGAGVFGLAGLSAIVLGNTGPGGI